MPHPLDRIRRRATARRVDEVAPSNLDASMINALSHRMMADSFRRAEGGASRPTIEGPKGSAMNPFTPLEMKEMVNEMAETENLPRDIHDRLIEAFTQEASVNYRLHVEPDDDTCDVYVNEIFIIQLKGGGKDPFVMGRNFIQIINRRLFDVDLLASDNPADDYGNDI